MTLPNIDELIDRVIIMELALRRSMPNAALYLKEAATALSTLQEQKRRLEEALTTAQRRFELIAKGASREVANPAVAAKEIRALLSGGGE